MTLPDKSENYIHRIGRVGRADCPGLALSIVGTVKEKMWYHQCKQLDQTRCRKIQSFDQGGCTIWFDEFKMMQEVETRLNQKITRLDSNQLVKGREKVLELQAKLHSQGSADTTESAQHVAILRPAVEQLANLEWIAQTNYLNLAFDKRWINKLK